MTAEELDELLREAETENARLRSALQAAERSLERLNTVADEAFGPFPVQGPEEDLTAIEQGVFALRCKLETAERELDSLRQRWADLERIQDRQLTLESVSMELAETETALTLLRATSDVQLATVTRERDEARDALRQLEWRVARNAGTRSGRRLLRWAHVMDVTGHGSTSASELCVRAGVDPNEYVGHDQGDAE